MTMTEFFGEPLTRTQSIWCVISVIAAVGFGYWLRGPVERALTKK